VIAGKVLLAGILMTFGSFLNAQRISKDEYISKYKKIAVDEMRRSGIPASITIAQGMIESENGNSTLARKSNNHFGIKCHKSWDGDRVYHDDDKDDECFRKYDSPEDSYVDHTNFLVKSKRYDFLFKKGSCDYEFWAKGLKKAGYATSRTYARDLIRVIEDNDLYRFDEGDCSKKTIKSRKPKSDEFEIDIKRRKIYERNRIHYIIVEKGEGLEKITKEMGLLSWELAKYNEIPEGMKIEPGQVLYTQPKRWRAEVGKDFHITQQDETMYSISQLYGIKLRKLYRKNRMEPGQEPVVGQKIWLRKRKPATNTDNKILQPVVRDTIQ
jgi:LysM repeat protein